MATTLANALKAWESKNDGAPAKDAEENPTKKAASEKAFNYFK